MTAPTHPGPDGTGLVHLGLLYDDVDDIVAGCLPEIHEALDAGSDVRVAVDRQGVRVFREALGVDADRVAFPSPAVAYADPTADFVERLRRELPRDRRTLLVGQYSERHPAAWDVAHAEQAVDLLLADVPLTVVCLCPRSGDVDHRRLAERSHALLLDAEGRAPNPDWLPPAQSSPAPLSPWGPPVADLRVGDADELAELRRRVSAVATGAGLTGAARDSAVLAAHEAVLLASGSPPDRPVPLATTYDVTMHAAPGVVITEVRAPHGVRGGSGDWRRTLLPRFCTGTVTHDRPDERLVRVLNTA